MSSFISWLTRTGTLTFDAEIDAVALPAHLAESLESADAITVEVQGNWVAFTAGMFRLVTNWNGLTFESRGLTVHGNARQIRYRVSIRQVVLFGTTVVAVMTTLTLLSHVWQPLLFMPLA